MQRTVPAVLAQVKPAPLALTKLSDAGSVSLTTTPLAASGPALLTVKV